MIEALAKEIYDKIVKIVSYKGKYKGNKIILLKKFRNNSDALVEALKDEGLDLTVYSIFAEDDGKNGFIYINSTLNLFKKVIPIINQCRFLLIEDYLPYLANVNFPNTEVIQLWHATGAIKTFGLEDSIFSKKTDSEQKRLKKVYQSMDKFVVGSNEMSKVFERSYNASEGKMLKFGRAQSGNLIKYQSYNLDTKCNILYAPTFRRYYKKEDILGNYQNVKDALSKATNEDCYKTYVQYHPKDMVNFGLVSDNMPLKNVGLLITDYSSLIWDYLLQNPTGKVLFYCPDYDKYLHETGLQPWFKELDKAVSVTELGVKIKDYVDDIYINNINLNNWNEFNTSDSIKMFINYINKGLNTPYVRK